MGDSIKERLARIEEKMDNLVSHIESHSSSNKTQLESICHRISSLESWRTGILGGFAAISAGVGMWLNWKRSGTP